MATFFGHIIEWVFGIFKKAKDGLAKASVILVNDIKPLLDSPSADMLAGIIDAITHTGLAETVLTQLRKDVPIFLTAEGIINTLNENSTEDEVKAELTKLLGLFPNFTPAQKAQFFTTVAASIYIDLHKLATGEVITFAEGAVIVEEAYQAIEAVKK